MTNEDTNLEVKIARLETKVDYVIGELKDLKDNFAVRLEKVEMQKFSSHDFIQFRNNEYSPDYKTLKDDIKNLKEDVEDLKKYRWIFAGIMALVLFLSPYIWDLIKSYKNL